MDRLYYLTEEQFTQLNRLLPPEDSGRGRPPKIRNREALEGRLHILRTGTPWRDVPQAYGEWHTMYLRWQRWVERGVWWNLLMVLKRLKRSALQRVFLDSTVVRAHQHAAGAPQKKGDQAIGRSRGGLSTTMHALCGSESDAVDLRSTAGQAGDAEVGEELIDALDPREGLRPAAMDKAYDSTAIRAKLAAKGIDPVIPPKANRLEIIVYDKAQYKQRNKVERLFNKLKQFRRVATRYEKLKATFRAFVTLALIIIMLR
jgi:transposase